MSERDDGRMSKIGITEDERWPTYFLSDKRGDHDIEVDSKTLAKWRAAIQAFDAVQDEMSEMYDEAKRRALAAAEIAKAEKALAEAQAKLDALKKDSGA